MEREFEVGQKVYLRDYPMGRPLNIFGKVVGYSGKQYINVLLMNGINAEQIKPYKQWDLMSEECVLSLRNKEQAKDIDGTLESTTTVE
tara:strand:+ start:57 stop:320 length:264 start_codon:yes stop_codon:yes gene_type:complete